MQTMLDPSEENVRLGMQRLEQYCRERRGEALRLALRWLPDRQMAEDVLQETCLRACAAIQRGLYDTSRPFVPWFWQGLRRQIFNKLNRQVKPDREHLLSLSQFTSEQAEVYGNLISYDDMDSLISQIDGSPEQDALCAIWDSLTALEQGLLYAAYVEGRPLQEMADVMGCTNEALRNRLLRTRDKARIHILVEMVAES